MYHTYADDIQLYITCDNMETSIEEAVNRSKIAYLKLVYGYHQML